MIWLLLACAEDACVTMCDAAEARYVVCMEERGLDWGLAYEDPEDHQNACATWVWEQEVLGTPLDCPALTETFAEGNCTEYDAAW